MRYVILAYTLMRYFLPCIMVRFGKEFYLYHIEFIVF